MLGNVDWLEIIAASIVSFLIGSIWYTRYLFGNKWLRSKGLDEKKHKELMEKSNFNLTRTLILEFITRVIRSYAYAQVLQYYNPSPLKDYIRVSVLICIGFSVTENIGSWLWDMKTFTLILINAGEVLTSSSATAVVFWLI